MVLIQNKVKTIMLNKHFMNDFSTVGNYDTVKVFEEGCIYCQTLWFTNKFEELNILCKRVPNQFELLMEELTRDGTYLTFYNQGKVVNKMRTIANYEAIKHLHDTGILDENYEE